MSKTIIKRSRLHSLWEELYETGYFDAVNDELKYITITNRKFFIRVKGKRKGVEIPI